MTKPFDVRIGHVLDAIREIPDESVHCCVTSPPYWGLRNYGIPDQIWGGDSDHAHVWGDHVSVNATNHTDKRRWNHTRNGRGEEQPPEKQVAWLRTEVDQGAFCECGAWRGSLGLEPNPHLFVEHIVKLFAEVRRVLKPDATVWLNLGDTYHNADKWGGGGANTGKHTKDDSGEVPSWTAVRRKWAQVPGLKPKDLVGIPWRCAFALQEDGWWLRSEIIWHKPNPMPESVTDRPTRSHEQLFLLSKSPKYFYDSDAVREAAVAVPKNCGRNSREYIDRDPVHVGRSTEPVIGGGRKALHGPTYSRHRVSIEGGQSLQSEPNGLRNRRSVWTIPTQPTPEAHFATFPVALAETCILAGCPSGGVVLDPFSGAGTTGLAAIKHGRQYIGIELSPEYAKITAERTDRHAPLFA